ncbi:SCO family protein [Comamonas sp. SCN 65-56]|mgnify:CR=1 FL=1|uniref:SCO family protein n=1 Tax=Comamonas sp. SCN 65-56 TaxID=1660095 RepID=UPI000A6E9342|nr:SCO family protein [Comamonas sp. SCN 65-56]
MTPRMRPTWLALAAIVVATFCGLHAMTHGFSAVTSDGARQLAIAESPRQLPAIGLVDSQGRKTDLRAVVADHPYTVVALVYTQCTSICLVMASSESFLQARLRDAGIEEQVGLLTLSFDPARDTPEVLAQYARRIKADSVTWTIATVADHDDLERLLDVFDVVVIPDGNGEYIHNGALFLVDGDGRMFEALAPDAADLAFERLAALVRSP